MSSKERNSKAPKQHNNIMTPVFPTWTKVILGTGSKTLEDFQRDLQRNNRTHRDVNESCVNSILRSCRFTTLTERKEISIVKVTPKDLNFKGYWVDKGDLPLFFKRALESGLGLCPPETGPQIYVQVIDLPEWLTIAMEPIKTKGGGRFVFEITHRPPPVRESYDGYSRDEKPLDDGPIVDCGGPLLTIEKYYENYRTGTGTNHPFAFIKS
jgi:hypothetical protein